MNYTISHLGKSFGRQKAVDDVSLDLHCGIYGLLGANGAGKTTLLRMLGGILPADSGELKLNGQPVSAKNGLAGKTGYLPQYPGFYPQMSSKEFLQFMAAIKGVDPDQAAETIDRLLKEVGLEEKAQSRIGSFSGGMKQRLGLAQALLGDPPVLILDEPTAGLDPKERIRFRNLLASLAKNKIILLSTHIVSDVESVADRILMMKKGKILMKGEPSSLTSRIAGQVWEVNCSPQESSELMARYPVSREANGANGRTILRLLSAQKPNQNAQPVIPDLNDLFLYVEQAERIDE